MVKWSWIDNMVRLGFVDKRWNVRQDGFQDEGLSSSSVPHNTDRVLPMVGTILIHYLVWFE